LILSSEQELQELQERSAAIERFRDALHKQKACFSSYLDVLKRQEAAIEQNDLEKVSVYASLEEQIAADIFSLQKVIVPLERRYRPIKAEIDILQLKSAISGLCRQSISLSKQNRDLLLRRMNEVRSEIQSIQKNPYRLHRYNSGDSALLLDMTT
jgi:hypothetical protein